MKNLEIPTTLLVTGGAGFIGSAFIRYLLTQVPEVKKVVNLDLLTYAGNLKNLEAIEQDPRYLFVRGNVCNGPLIEEICRREGIQAIVHFAAETHVDRSIETPRSFYDTNVGGTLSLLEVVRRFPLIHFHCVSTDEVYGTLAETGYFSESSPYRPNSPYAASKAAADHFVRAYGETYGISVTISHCSNNYGPCQYREKFIPRMLLSCLHKQPFPVYGEGKNVRDWLYVDDHAEALWMILKQGKRGEVYDIGGGCEKQNIDLLHLIIEQVSRLRGELTALYDPLITFVPDRPGHDLRYAIDCQKIQKEIGWKPKHDLTQGLQKTVAWYMQNLDWLK